MILALLKRFGGWLAAGLAGLAMIFSLMRASRSVGKAKAEVEAAKERERANEAQAAQAVIDARADADRQAETMGKANDVQAEVNRLDGGVAVDRLRDEWARD